MLLALGTLSTSSPAIVLKRLGRGTEKLSSRKRNSIEQEKFPSGVRGAIMPVSTVFRLWARKGYGHPEIYCNTQFFVLFICRDGDQTQGIVHARHACCQSYTSTMRPVLG